MIVKQTQHWECLVGVMIIMIMIIITISITIITIIIIITIFQGLVLCLVGVAVGQFSEALLETSTPVPILR